MTTRKKMERSKGLEQRLKLVSQTFWTLSNPLCPRPIYFHPRSTSWNHP